MGVDHLEMPLVHRQVHRLAKRPPGMVDVGAEVGELHKILEVLDRAIAATLVEVVHEGRAVIRREYHRVAADEHVAFRVAGVLHILGGRRGAELARQPARKVNALALDVAAGVVQQFRCARKIPELDADLFEQRVRVALDDLQPLGVQHLGQRDLACDVGNGDVRALRPGGAPRFAPAARFARGGRGGIGHFGRSLPRAAILARAGLCDRLARNSPRKMRLPTP